MSNILQLKITLKGSKPPIWRRILVSSDTELSDLHLIIQTTMGWNNYHLHQFIIGNNYFGPVSEDEDEFDDSDMEDYSGIKVSDVLRAEKSKITYEYDFGDSWVHTIELEKLLPADSTQTLPVCVAGKMNCPPEDCGGVWGYATMLEVLQQPKHPEYEYYSEFVDKDFDPTEFDIDFVNERLQEDGFGSTDVYE